MVTITIKKNSKQAKTLIEMLKTFDFVGIKESKMSKSTKPKSKSVIEISLEEEKKAKQTFIIS